MRWKGSATSGCTSGTTLIDYQYIGACGYTDNSSFTLSEDLYTTRIRLWYDRSVAGDNLKAILTGSNGFSLAANLVKNDNCQGN